MLRNEWLAHLDGLVVFRGLLAAEPLCTLHAAPVSYTHLTLPTIA
mgnify:CR=1 FL=1